MDSASGSPSPLRLMHPESGRWTADVQAPPGNSYVRHTLAIISRMMGVPIGKYLSSAFSLTEATVPERRLQLGTFTYPRRRGQRRYAFRGANRSTSTLWLRQTRQLFLFFLRQ